MCRETIINDIVEILKPLKANVLLFNTLFLDDSMLPAIVVKDKDDSITYQGFEVLNHELEISVEVISVNWVKNNSLVDEVLVSLKELKSQFNKLDLVSINRANIELHDKEYFNTEISLKAYYVSEIWSF